MECEWCEREITEGNERIVLLESGIRLGPYCGKEHAFNYIKAVQGHSLNQKWKIIQQPVINFNSVECEIYPPHSTNL